MAKVKSTPYLQERQEPNAEPKIPFGQVNWQKGDALSPQTFAHLFPEVGGVVHTLGTLLEDGAYKQAVRTGDLPGLLKSLAGVGKDSNPLRRDASALEGRGTYEALNRDSGMRDSAPLLFHAVLITLVSGTRL